jgi:hypothetical protein
VSQEAIRIPSVGAVFWAEAMPDGSSGARAIAGPPPVMKVTLTAALPNGLSAETGGRGLVILTPPILYDHTPTEAELAAAPPAASVTVRGIAEALDGRFHPRQFRVTPTPAAPSYVALRPSLQATRIGEAGAVVLNLRWQGAGPASWSVLQLACKRNGVTLGFSGQADVMGDVIVPLTGLPPLPASQANDSMTLTAQGDPTQSGQPFADPDALKAVQVSVGGAFAAQQTFPVTRGRISTAATLAIPGVTLQSV